MFFVLSVLILNSCNKDEIPKEEKYNVEISNILVTPEKTNYYEGEEIKVFLDYELDDEKSFVYSVKLNNDLGTFNIIKTKNESYFTFTVFTASSVQENIEIINIQIRNGEKRLNKTVNENLGITIFELTGIGDDLIVSDVGLENNYPLNKNFTNEITQNYIEKETLKITFKLDSVKEVDFELMLVSLENLNENAEDTELKELKINELENTDYYYVELPTELITKNSFIIKLLEIKNDEEVFNLESKNLNYTIKIKEPENSEFFSLTLNKSKNSTYFISEEENSIKLILEQKNLNEMNGINFTMSIEVLNPDSIVGLIYVVDGIEHELQRNKLTINDKNNVKVDFQLTLDRNALEASTIENIYLKTIDGKGEEKLLKQDIKFEPIIVEKWSLLINSKFDFHKLFKENSFEKVILLNNINIRDDIRNDQEIEGIESFEGVFEGNNKTLTDYSYFPLFQKNNGTIKNLNYSVVFNVGPEKENTIFITENNGIIENIKFHSFVRTSFISRAPQEINGFIKHNKGLVKNIEIMGYYDIQKDGVNDLNLLFNTNEGSVQNVYFKYERWNFKNIENNIIFENMKENFGNINLESSIYRTLTVNIIKTSLGDETEYQNILLDHLINAETFKNIKNFNFISNTLTDSSVNIFENISYTNRFESSYSETLVGGPGSRSLFGIPGTGAETYIINKKILTESVFTEHLFNMDPHESPEHNSGFDLSIWNYVLSDKYGYKYEIKDFPVHFEVNNV